MESAPPRGRVKTGLRWVGLLAYCRRMLRTQRHILDVLFGRWSGHAPPLDDTLWHKCQPYLLVKGVDGKFLEGEGQIWRRWHDGSWEYSQDVDPEEWDRWCGRQF